MPIHQEIDNAHAYFMQYDTDANKEGAQYFFGFGILHRFELALEMARGSEDTRYFREDLSRDIPTLNTIIGNCLNGRMPRTEAEQLIAKQLEEARSYLLEKGCYSEAEVDFADFDLAIRSRYAREAVDGDEFSFSLDEIRNY